MSKISQTRVPYCLLRFCRSIGKTPDELVAWQTECFDSKDRHVAKMVLRALEAHIDALDGTHGYKLRDFTAVRSFLDYHDVPLPRDRHYEIRATKSPTPGTLTLEDVRAIVSEAALRQDLCMHSMILVQFKSFSGVAELDYINRTWVTEISQQLRDNADPLRVNMLKGRKNNPRAWFTFIEATEAGASLKAYFEKVRGWPKKGEPIWLNENHEPMRPQAYQDRWRSLERHTKLIPTKVGHSRGDRYGKGPHELRDLARSLVHEAHSQEHKIRGKKLLFDAACPEFWMGHGIDRLNYNKFWKTNPDGVRDQYLIAEPYLSITSGQRQELSTVAKENEELRERLAKLEGQFEIFAKGKFGNGP
jgi:hypothetical protein